MLSEEVLDMLRGEHFVVQKNVNELLTNVVNRYLFITQFHELVVIGESQFGGRVTLKCSNNFGDYHS